MHLSDGLGFEVSSLSLCASSFTESARFRRMEKLDLLNWGGRAKILGTAICVGGAIFMTLFKGPVIGLQIPRSESSDWILGAFLLVSGVCAWSLCLIYQVGLLF